MKPDQDDSTGGLTRLPAVADLPSRAPAAKRPGAPEKNKNARRVTGKLRECLVALAAGRATNATAAAELIGGITDRALQKALHKPHVQAELHALIKQDLRTTGVLRARDAYTHLLEKAESEYVRADLAKDALAQAGVRDRVDGSARQPAAGSISIVINARPGDQVHIGTPDVVHDGTAQRLDDEQSS